MRILTFSRESYPAGDPAGYALLHQSMALADMGHDVHLYNLTRPPLRLTDYLDSYELDLVFLNVELLRSDWIRRTLQSYRRNEAVHMVGALYSMPPPPPQALDCLDFVFTPWKGSTVTALAETIDIRYLPFGYNAILHKRTMEVPTLGPIFVGNTTAEKQAEAEEYLRDLRDRRIVLCIGPEFEQKHMDPFALGRVYAAARCLPNFHYSWTKGDDLILNERFWQTARCGVPVNDYHALMAEVLDKYLVENFCFADKRIWQERIRSLNAGESGVDPEALSRLDAVLAGHSYHHRMMQLMDWII